MTSSRCGLQAAEAHQVLDVLRREQVLAGRERRRRRRRRSRQAARSRADRTAPRTSAARTAPAPWRRRAPRRGRTCELASTASSPPRRQDRFHRLDAATVLGERHAADLHLHHGVAGIEMAAHLVLQVLGGLARRIPAAADVAEHLVGDLAAVVALGQQAMQRLAGDLGDRVPDRDLDGADADRALAVAAGFLVLHHHGEDFLRIEIVAGLVEQRLRIGLEDARDEARAHLRAAGVAAGGVEGEAARPACRRGSRR